MTRKTAIDKLTLHFTELFKDKKANYLKKKLFNQSE